MNNSPVMICEAFTEEHRATRETCGVKKKSMSPRSVLDAIPPSKHRNSSVERENHCTGAPKYSHFFEENINDEPPRTPEVCKSAADFEMIAVLGKGSFGTVTLCRQKKSGNFLAVKAIRKLRIKKKKQIERIQLERRVLELVSEHHFLMECRIAFQSNSTLYIGLEFCDGGELFFHLSKFKRFPEPVVRFYAAQIICAIGFLHRHGIVYRDLKPENVLLTSAGHIKLGDFGLCKENVWESCHGALSVCGTPEYMAPEIITKSGHGTAVDWWSLGMVVHEMLTGLPPWFTKDRKKLFQRIRFSTLKLPESVTEELASFLRKLLNRNPHERLGTQGGIASIKSHEFFRVLYAPLEPEIVAKFPSTFFPASIAEPFSWNRLEVMELTAPIQPYRNTIAKSEITANFDECFTNLPVDASISSTVNTEEGNTPVDNGEDIPSFLGWTYVANDEYDDGSRADWHSNNDDNDNNEGPLINQEKDHHILKTAISSQPRGVSKTRPEAQSCEPEEKFHSYATLRNQSKTEIIDGRNPFQRNFIRWLVDRAL